MAHIFVYGTLKRGQPNHKVMLDHSHGLAAFRGRGCTVESFPLVIAGEHNIPWLLYLPGKGHCVTGEIYEVDEQMLRFLDDFEDCPSMYQRTALQVQVLEWEGDGDPGDSVQCFVYTTATYAPEWLFLPTMKAMILRVHMGYATTPGKTDKGLCPRRQQDGGNQIASWHKQSVPSSTLKHADKTFLSYTLI